MGFQRVAHFHLVRNLHNPLDMLFLNPFVSLPGVNDYLKITWPTAKTAVERLVKLGILREVSGRKRGRIYCAEELLNIVAEG